MTQPLTDSTRVIADRYFDILTAVKASLGIEDVWFGDQSNVPRTPAVCVEPGVKRRDLDGVPDMTLMFIDTHFLLYHSVISEQQDARRASIDFAERIETYLHHNYLQLNAADGRRLTVHSYCTDFDPGYAYKNNTLYHAVQMTFTSQVKVSLRNLY